MPPLQAEHPLAYPAPFRKIINVNVGGRIFQTSPSTLKLAGPGSLFAEILRGIPAEEPFFDRDPDLFAVLLSVLRTRRLPSKSEKFHADDLIEESRFYGVEQILRAAMKPPPLDGLDMEKTRTLVSSGRDFPSALASASDGSLLLGHGSKISVYDWALRKQTTILTHFNAIDSLHRVSPSHALAGAVDFPGLQVYDITQGRHQATLGWNEDAGIRPRDPTVQSIASNPSLIFASFESSRKNANTILLFDRESLNPAGELGRQVEILGGNNNSSCAATRLHWIPLHGLLLSSGVSGGAFGHCGHMRLWDVRSGKATWEWREPNPGQDGDCFADVAASEELCRLFKVDVRSGDLWTADLRVLDAGNPWMSLGDSNPRRSRAAGGAQNRLLCYGSQVFCSRGGDLEVWSQVGSNEIQQQFAKNYVGKQSGERILQTEAGGDRMFVARREMQAVEVWESARSKPASRVLY